jgi:hypothetical protein
MTPSIEIAQLSCFMEISIMRAKQFSPSGQTGRAASFNRVGSIVAAEKIVVACNPCCFKHTGHIFYGATFLPDKPASVMCKWQCNRAKMRLHLDIAQRNRNVPRVQ